MRAKVSLTPASPDAAYKAGVRLLTGRDRSRAELARLLTARGYTRSVTQIALDRLTEEGYLNDRRFAIAWTRGRLLTKPMGQYRVSRELETRGIEVQLVREVLEEIYEEGEESLARRAAAAKLSTLRRLPASSRTVPMARFLQRRGFSTDVIRRLLDEEQQG